VNEKGTRRLREAGRAMHAVLDTFQANDVPIDSCILAAEVLRDTGRELGYRARVFPVKVRPVGPDGQEGRAVGHGPPTPESAAADRYHGHVLCLWDDRVAIDATAPQLEPVPEGYVEGQRRTLGRIIPSFAVEVPRSFVKGEPFTVKLENGWMIEYEPFDDGGDWARNDEVDAQSRVTMRHNARVLARAVRRA
jgi:hypothetical protein